MSKTNHKDYKAQNAQDEKGQPNKRFRVCVVTMTNRGGEGVMLDALDAIPNETNHFTIPHKHGAESAILTAGRRVIVVDSGACFAGKVSNNAISHK